MSKKILPLLAVALVVLLVNSSVALAGTFGGTTASGTSTLIADSGEKEVEQPEKPEEPEAPEQENEQEDLDKLLQGSAQPVQNVDEDMEDGVQVTLPKDGSVTNDGTIDISGLAGAGYTITVKVENASGEQTFNVTPDANGQFNLADLPLDPGKNKIEVAVYDATGKKVGEIEKRIVKPGASLASLKDVKGNWAEDTIAKLVAMGVISGNPDGTFKPGDDVNGAQFAKMLDVAANLNVGGDKLQGFEDLPEGFWATDYIATAQASGIIKGDDDKAFDPNKPLTRVQMAVLLVRALGLEDKVEGATGTSTNFTDASSIPGWAQGYVDLAVQMGLLQGMPDGSFQPNLPADRAQAAALIARFLNAKESLNSSTGSATTSTTSTTSSTTTTVTP